MTKSTARSGKSSSQARSRSRPSEPRRRQLRFTFGARGRDLLIEVVARTQAQLEQAERELNDLIVRFRELIESTGMVDR